MASLRVPGKDEVEAKRREYMLDMIAHARDHAEDPTIEHILVVTCHRGGDVAVHSGFATNEQCLWLLARAIHQVNLVLDGDVEPGPLDSGHP